MHKIQLELDVCLCSKGKEGRGIRKREDVLWGVFTLVMDNIYHHRNTKDIMGGLGAKRNS